MSINLGKAPRDPQISLIGYKTPEREGNNLRRKSGNMARTGIWLILLVVFTAGAYGEDCLDEHVKQVAERCRIKLSEKISSNDDKTSSTAGVTQDYFDCLTDVGAYTDPAAKKVKIGVIVPETGEAGYLGKVVRAGIQEAVDDVNQLCSGGGCVQVQPLYRDSQSSPSVALRLFTELYHGGVRVFAGLVTSAETEAVASYAKEYGLQVTLLSASSTASQLCEYSDILVRLSMDDKAQAEVIFDIMQNARKQQILPIVRDDIYGNGLIEDIATKADSVMGGLEVLQPIRYDPNTITDNGIAKRVVQRIVQARAQYPDAKILLVSYSEAQLLLQAASEYPALTETSWMVTDSLVFSNLKLPDSIVLEGLTYTGKTEGTKSLKKYASLFQHLHTSGLPSMPQAALAYDSILYAYNAGTVLASTMSVYGLTGALEFSTCGERTTGYYKYASRFGSHVEHTILSRSQWISLVHYKATEDEDSGTLPIQVTKGSLAAAIIHKNDILPTFSSAERNCTEATVTISLVDPDTMLKNEWTYTPASFPDTLTIPAQNGWSSYASCLTPDGSYTAQTDCTPADEAGETVECSTQIKTPKSKRAIPIWVAGCGVAGIGCGIYGIGVGLGWWEDIGLVDVGCGAAGLGCGIAGLIFF